MKKKRTWLRLLSGVLLLGCLLSSCRGREDTPVESNTDPAPESVSFDLGEYTVVRGDDAAEYEKIAAGTFGTLFYQKFSASAPLGTDYVKKGSEPDPDAKEVLIGHTNRQTSAKAAQSCPEAGYVVLREGNRIAILGSDDFMTLIAVEYFMEQVVGDSKELSLPADYTYVHTNEDLSIGGQSGWKIIRPAMAGVKEMDAIVQTRNALNQSLTSALSLASDREAVGEREILIGHTNRRESEYVYKTLPASGYAVCVVNGKLVIAGDNAYCLKAATSEFFSKYVESGKKAETLTLSASMTTGVRDAYMRLDADGHTVVNADTALLSRLYSPYRVYTGDLHAHSNTGPKGDGSSTLRELRAQAEALGLDFMLVADHRQTTHMDHADWDTGFFLTGTELGTNVTDVKDFGLHYIIFTPTAQGLKDVMTHFKSLFGYNGTTFSYPSLSLAQLAQLNEYVRSVGGSMTVCHPSQFVGNLKAVPDDPMTWYIGDGSLFEVLYCGTETSRVMNNYRLWVGMLNAGKRVYCSAATDTHEVAYDNGSLNSVFAAECRDELLIGAVARGLFCAGKADIRMCIGNVMMGGSVAYADGQTLNVSVGDVGRAYRLRIYTDTGIAYEEIVKSGGERAVALAVQDRMYYRVEIASEDGGTIIALGQPIWLD